MRIAIVSILIAMAGCTVQQMRIEGGWPATVTVEQRVKQVGIGIDASAEPWAEQIAEGMSAWRTFGIEFFEDESLPSIRCSSTELENGSGIALTNSGGIFLNCAWFTAPNVTDHARVHALTHEMGHWLGLSHVADDQAVMSPSLTISEPTPEEFTQADVDEFYRVHSL